MCVCVCVCVWCDIEIYIMYYTSVSEGVTVTTVLNVRRFDNCPRLTVRTWQLSLAFQVWDCVTILRVKPWVNKHIRSQATLGGVRVMKTWLSTESRFMHMTRCTSHSSARRPLKWERAREWWGKAYVCYLIRTRISPFHMYVEEWSVHRFKCTSKA